MKNFIPTKLRSGDEVIVVAGKDIGKKGTESPEVLGSDRISADQKSISDSRLDRSLPN